jgi:hypothetical protein
MYENIVVNYLNVDGKPFENFIVTTYPVGIRPPNEVNMRKLYDILRQLSSEGIADAEFKRDTIFVKGDDEEAINRIRISEVAYVGEERKTLKLEVSNDLNIMRALFYRALSRYLEKRGFKLLWGRRRKWKKILPLDITLEKLLDQELALMIGNDLVLYRGLYVLLEIFDDGGAILWVDLYSPIIKLSEQRPLSSREAKLLGLRDTYTSYIPTPRKRFEILNKLLRIICDESKLIIKFADGYSITLTCTFPTLRVH